MLYTCLLKCIYIIFTNQNTHHIFHYKTLGNVTFEIRSLKGRTCIYYQYETPVGTLEIDQTNLYSITMTHTVSNMD